MGSRLVRVEESDFDVTELRKMYPEANRLKLSDKQLLFCAYFCTNGYDPHRAVEQSGYIFELTRQRSGCAMRQMRCKRVQEMLAIMLKSISATVRLGLVESLFEITKSRSFYDIDMFYDMRTGDKRTYESLTREQRRCVDSIKRNGKKNFDYVLADREKNLDRLVTILRITENKDDEADKITNELADQLRKLVENADKQKRND